MTEAAGAGDELSPAADAFADFLARVDDGEAVDFAAFCAEHPALVPELLRLHQRFQALRGAFDDLHGPAATPIDASVGGIRLEPDEAARARLLRDLPRQQAAADRYTVSGEFARGGMAAILRARDGCLRRTLAMKVLLGDGGAQQDPRALARFLEEAQITGQLDHPGIPPVHELGVDPSGRVYFTMPLIRGRNLSQVYELVRAGEDGWSLTRAVAVLQRVCDTVAYAHSRGVVHRDLKPANVMVGRFGETYVMDWGLARVRGHEVRGEAAAADGDDGWSSIRTVRRDADGDADSPLITLDGHVVGTPAYMAPEQARGELDRVGPAADVYAIGAMLYELLAGHMPHVPSGVRLSARTVLARVIEGPPAALAATRRDLPDELVAICERAMAREPEQRYAGAAELGDDLRAFSEGRVVRAHATGTWIELRKWIGRNRALAAASAALVLALGAALVVTIVLGGRAARSAAGLASELRLNRLERGRLYARAGNIEQAEKLLWSEHLRTPDAADTRWALWDLHARHLCLAASALTARSTAAVLTAADSRLLVGDDSGRVQVLEPWSLRPLSSLEPPAASAVAALVADAHGERAYSAHDDGALYVWNLRDARLERDLRQPGAAVSALALSPDDGELLVGCRDGSIRRHRAADGFRGEELPAHGKARVTRLVYADDGRRYASLGWDWAARVWAQDGSLLHARQSPDMPGAIAFLPGPDGALLLGGNDRMLTCIDPAGGDDLWQIQKSDSVRWLALADGGRLLLSCGWQRLDLWSLPERRLRRTVALPQNGMLLVDRAGHLAVTVHPLEIRAWDLEDRGRVAVPARHEGRAVSTLDRGGRFMATGDSAGVVRVFDRQAPPGTPALEFGRHDGRVRCVAFSPDGRLLLSGGADHVLRLWDVASGELLRDFADHDDATQQSACFAPDGRTIASAMRRDSRSWVVLRRTDDGSLVEEFEVPTSQIVAIAFAPDGQRLAYTARGRGLRLSTLDGTVLGEFRTPAQAWTVAFRPDGQRLATGTWARTVHVFDPASGAVEQVLEGHAGTVWSTQWAQHDPRLMLSAAADGEVRLWDLDSGRPLLLLTPFEEGVDALAVALSADGRYLAATGAQPEALVFDLHYYERHMAGCAPMQLARFAGEVTDGAAAQVRRWAAAVSARPWR